MQPLQPLPPENLGNLRTVFVVQVDNSKDFSDAKRYGALRAVFGNPRKPYFTERMIARARKTLSAFEPGDYLLMIGDPALCAVCMTLAAERCSTIHVLSWDRNTLQYMPQRWDFGPVALSKDFEPAED